MATAIDYTEILAPVGRRLIYNPGKRLDTLVGGETYRIPARTEKYLDMLRELRGVDASGRVRNLTADDEARFDALPPGVRPIEDRSTQRNGSADPNHRDLVELPAKEILNILLGDNGRDGKVGMWGVRALFGNDKDKLVIKEADEAYRKRLMGHAIAATTAHRAQNAKYKEMGLPPAPPTDELLELYRVESEMRRGGAGIPCEVCFLPVATAEEMKQHMSEIHALDSKAAPEPVSGPEAGEVEAPVRRGPGRPRKVEAQL